MAGCDDVNLVATVECCVQQRHDCRVDASRNGVLDLTVYGITNHLVPCQRVVEVERYDGHGLSLSMVGVDEGIPHPLTETETQINVVEGVFGFFKRQTLKLGWVLVSVYEALMPQPHHLKAPQRGQRRFNMTSFIIGDVHGMKPELVALIETLKPTVEDEITFVGDLVDKGDDSPGVVRFVRELSLTHNVVLVEGNHEDKHKRFRRNLTVRPEVAAQQAERSPELSEITAGLSEADVAFLDSAVPFHRVAKHGILVVHGGIPGDMVEFPATVEEAMSFTGKAKRRMEKILRTRTIDAETGKFIALGRETEADPFWAEVHDGRFGHVVFGHEPFMDGVAHFPHATGIDTGAVFGGRLTAMVVDADGERSFVSVPGRKVAEHRQM